MRVGNRADVAFEDLTARARIRDAALQHFAEHGYDRTTIREIAGTAGVSAGLVRHHFGSKDDLRRACDEYALRALRGYVDEALTEEGLKNPEIIAEARSPLHPLQRYLARALIDRSETAGDIFDEMVAMTERTLEPADERRPDPPSADRRTRATLIVAMALGIPAFQSHIARSIGVDLFSPEGDRRVTLALLDIYSHPALTPDSAGRLEEALRPPET